MPSPWFDQSFLTGKSISNMGNWVPTDLTSPISGGGRRSGANPWAAPSQSVPSAYDLLARNLSGVAVPNIGQFRGMYANSLGNVTPRKVEMTQEEQNAVQLANSLMTGQYGNLKQLMTGTPDMGLLEQAVLDPSRREFREKVIPGIEQAFSGGPYGGSYNTGARREMQSRAYSDQQTLEARARQAEIDKAKVLGLEASKMIPALTEVAGTGRRVEEGNVSREIQASVANMEARYREAGLDQGAMDRALNATRTALEKANMLWSAKSNDEKMKEEVRQFDLSLALKERELQGNLGIANAQLNNAWNMAVAAENTRRREIEDAQRAGELSYQGMISARDPNADSTTNMWNMLLGGSQGYSRGGAGLTAASMLYGNAMNMYLVEQAALQNKTMQTRSITPP